MRVFRLRPWHLSDIKLVLMMGEGCCSVDVAGEYAVSVIYYPLLGQRNSRAKPRATPILR